MSKYLYSSVGIDPGWKNLGAALVMEELNTFKVRVLDARTLNISKEPEVLLRDLFLQYAKQLPWQAEISTSSDYLVVERYVAYSNSAESENITMAIGMIRMHRFMQLIDRSIELMRAIEWKTELIKLLNKHYGFENPSLELDKKFSLAAAKFITVNPEIIKTDHEADAICLAALPLLRRKIEQKILEEKEKGRTKTDAGISQGTGKRGQSELF